MNEKQLRIWFYIIWLDCNFNSNKRKMRLIQVIIVVLFFTNNLIAQDKPAYRLFNSKGKVVKYDKMVSDLAESDMVFFGEYHTDPIAHWIQLELSKSLFDARGNQLYFGAEMFENGNQLVLNEYLAGFYPDKKNSYYHY